MRSSSNPFHPDKDLVAPDYGVALMTSQYIGYPNEFAAEPMATKATAGRPVTH